MCAQSYEGSGIFGLATAASSARLVYIPVPWEATTSYGKGTAQGPEAIFKASSQVDLWDGDYGEFWRQGVHWLEAPSSIQAADKKVREGTTAEINRLGAQVNDAVYKLSLEHLRAGRKIAVVGGDHSAPYGALRAMGEHLGGDFGVLHFDAHHDLREAYQGFEWSHASIFWNVLTHLPKVSKLVQVGIRDFCIEERDFAVAQGARVHVHQDADLARRQYRGETWDKICADILAPLPQKVWISFDIDGLDPRFCPHTGTPVPGGLDFNQATALIYKLTQSGREVIGFDLCEVSPDLACPDNEWDANVGARMLFKLSGACLSAT